MVDREEVLGTAVYECMKEMYAKSQPSADYDQLIQDYKDGKIGKDETIYDRYYLSAEEFKYIKEKYKKAYRINEEWKDNISVLEEYLINGGYKDKYIEEKEDEDGFVHPGYRSHEKVLPIKNLIYDILLEQCSDKDAETLSSKISDKVMETIGYCKNFYRFDREESKFEFSICLGASPTSNAETVKKWWKENKGVDIEIEERNPKLFWYYDEGYTDDDLAIEFEDYGENWKEKLFNEWKDEVRKKKEENERKLKELLNKQKEME